MDFTRSSRWLKTIGCKWVFIRKRDNTGNIVQWKVRLIAQGFSQKPGTDYDNDGTFAPVMQFKTLQTILAHGTVDKLHLRQFDVKGAYLNGYLNKTIYMQQLPGYEDWSGKVCLLKRSLYGLKKARNVWNQKLNWVLQVNNFRQLKTDYCCYIKLSGNNYFIPVVWVNDFLSASTKEDLNNDIEHDLNVHFKVKLLGRPKLLLGIKISIGENSISLSQTNSIDFLLDKYRLTNVNPVSTPMDPNIKLEVKKAEEASMKDPKIEHSTHS